MNTNSTLRERIGVYVLGVAIGLMIVAMMFMARQSAHRQREAERASRSQPAVEQLPAAPDLER